MKLRGVVAAVGAVLASFSPAFADDDEDKTLRTLLQQHGFTGQIEQRFKEKLGRTLDPKLVNLGRLIFFDRGLGVHKSNSCSGCHSPTAGFGDTQPIAIGVGNNNIVGPGRTGERNQRRSPMLTNVGLYPALMWNGRFSSLSGDPFDNSKGFLFPIPESRGLFPPNDPRYPHLLAAQAHIPFTELPEMAGFGGLNSGQQKAPVVMSIFNSQRFPVAGTTSGTVKKLQTMTGDDPNDCSMAKERPIKDNDTCSDFKQFDDVPAADKIRLLPEPYKEVPSRNGPIRHRVLEFINENNDHLDKSKVTGEYRMLFSQLFPSVADGNEIDLSMIGKALSEFQLSLTFADAPIDRYARGDTKALGVSEKRGAILFFGKANCVSCHAVSGKSNEMFSDFQSHVAGIPAVAPVFGKSTGNVPFRDKDGVLTLKGQFDMGLFDITGIELDQFKFRTSPLRNVSLQPFFFHNGAFKTLKDAVNYHLNTEDMIKSYSPQAAGLPDNLSHTPGDPSVVIEHLAPQLKKTRAPKLTTDEEASLVAFLEKALLDDRAKPANLRPLIPDADDLPSGFTPHVFQ